MKTDHVKEINRLKLQITQLQEMKYSDTTAEDSKNALLKTKQQTGVIRDLKAKI